MHFNPDPVLPENLADKYKDFVYEKAHYLCGGKIFFNKIAAMEEEKSSGSPIEFIIDHRWNDVDFSKPPNEDIFAVYQKRAKQIRKKYDYVRLWFGAGWDSHTVLKSFIDSDSHIDEIVINRKYLFSPSEVSAFEETIFVEKIIDYYRDHLKSTKITYLDYDWKYFDELYSSPEWLRYNFSTLIEFRGGTTSNNNYYRYPEFLEKFDQGIRAADVRGTERAKFMTVKNQMFWYLSDKIYKPGFPGHVDFFRGIDFPEMSVLEAHIVSKQLEGNRPWYDIIKTIRLPLPVYSPFIHKYVSKYNPARTHDEEVKGVIMEAEAAMHEETAYLFEKFYDSVEHWRQKFPHWFKQPWLPKRNFEESYGCFQCLKFKKSLTPQELMSFKQS